MHPHIIGATESTGLLVVGKHPQAVEVANERLVMAAIIQDNACENVDVDGAIHIVYGACLQ